MRVRPLEVKMHKTPNPFLADDRDYFLFTLWCNSDYLFDSLIINYIVGLQKALGNSFNSEQYLLLPLLYIITLNFDLLSFIICQRPLI